MEGLEWFTTEQWAVEVRDQSGSGLFYTRVSDRSSPSNSQGCPLKIDRIEELKEWSFEELFRLWPDMWLLKGAINSSCQTRSNTCWMSRKMVTIWRSRLRLGCQKCALRPLYGLGNLVDSFCYKILIRWHDYSLFDYGNKYVACLTGVILS